MPEKKPWTEPERFALMVSIIASYGTAPKWDQVKLPTGRTKMACWHAYRAALDAAKGVALDDNQNGEVGKNRSKKSPAAKNTTAKGKRARETEEVQQSDMSETEKPKAKKLKTEDDEKEV
ncbi:MAG: hypothetical protein Q9192_004623 [Flavoplaca navasiana]